MAKLTPHFDDSEWACKDGTPLPEKYRENAREVCEDLEVVRVHIGEPLNITSGYRTPTHNAKVGGANNSTHLTAKGCDPACKNMTGIMLYCVFESLIAAGKIRNGGLGYYPKTDSMHYDHGPIRRWIKIKVR